MIGTFIGLIIILAKLTDPSTFGRGLSVSFMTILYALVLYAAVVVPFRTGLEKKCNEQDN